MDRLSSGTEFLSGSYNERPDEEGDGLVEFEEVQQEEASGDQELHKRGSDVGGSGGDCIAQEGHENGHLKYINTQLFYHGPKNTHTKKI